MKHKPGNFLHVPNSGNFTGIKPGIIKKESMQLLCFISRNISTPPKPRLGLFGLIQQIKEQINCKTAPGPGASPSLLKADFPYLTGSKTCLLLFSFLIHYYFVHQVSDLTLGPVRLSYYQHFPGASFLYDPWNTQSQFKSCCAPGTVGHMARQEFYIALVQDCVER